jgi:hypothetical protein
VTPTRAALASAALGAVAVAAAPAIPDSLRSLVLVVALAAWAGGTGWAVAAAVRRGIGAPWSAFPVMGLVGMALAALATTELEAIRVLGHHPALVWNVDWQYALGHAQAIARTGGLGRSLDYAGVPITYHVGPAWFAGAARRSLGVDPGAVLFALVPLLCTVTFAIAGVRLLSTRGVSAAAAVAATGIVMALPGVAFTLPTTAYCLVLTSCRTSSVLWTFSPDIALNTFQAIAAGMAALALLLDAEPWPAGTFLAAAGLGALVMIKPQSFVGYGLLAGLTGLGYMAGVPGFRPRSGRVLTAALAAAMLAAGLLAALPHIDGRFGTPAWAPGRTEFPFVEDRLVPVALLLGALLAARRYLRRNLAVRTLLLTAAAGVLVLGAFWALVRIPVRPEIVSRMIQLGADPTQRADFAISLQPLRLLVALLSIAGLIESARRLRGGRLRIAHGVGWMTAASPLLFIVPSLAAPAAGYQAEEDVGLLEVLQRLPDRGGVLIASDLADPAEDYRRPLRGFSLTAYTGRPFYVADLQYANHAEPDAAQRMVELRTFFGSPWTAWHSRWLARSGITGVLVSARCVPAWYGRAHPSLREAAHRGRWTGFTVTAGGGGDTLRIPAPPPWHDMVPAYGLAECLTGLRPSPAAGD